jgi:hypothetical protein
MPRPKASPTSYQDVIPMLNFAVENNGARFECGSLGNAIRTVQRMNQYRTIERRINYDAHKSAGPSPGQREHEWNWEVQSLKYQVSIYDNLIIRRPTNSMVIIDRKPDQPYTQAYYPDGRPADDIRSSEEKNMNKAPPLMPTSKLDLEIANPNDDE